MPSALNEAAFRQGTGGRETKTLGYRENLKKERKKDALAYVHMDLRLNSAMFFPSLSELN